MKVANKFIPMTGSKCILYTIAILALVALQESLALGQGVCGRVLRTKDSVLQGAEIFMYQNKKFQGKSVTNNIGFFSIDSRDTGKHTLVIKQLKRSDTLTIWPEQQERGESKRQKTEIVYTIGDSYYGVSCPIPICAQPAYFDEPGKMTFNRRDIYNRADLHSLPE